MHLQESLESPIDWHLNEASVVAAPQSRAAEEG